MVEKPVTLDLPQARQWREERRRTACSASSTIGDGISTTDRAARGAVGQLGTVINVESRLGQWSSCVGPRRGSTGRGGGTKRRSAAGGSMTGAAISSTSCGGCCIRRNPFACSRNSAETSGARLRRLRPRPDRLRRRRGRPRRNQHHHHPPLPRWHLDGTTGSADSPHSPSFDLDTWATFEFTSTGGGDSQLLAALAGLTERQIWEHFARAVRTNCSGGADRIGVADNGIARRGTGEQPLGAGDRRGERGAVGVLKMTSWRHSRKCSRIAVGYSGIRLMACACVVSPRMQRALLEPR